MPKSSDLRQDFSATLPEAPLNIQPMIDALSPRDTTHKPRPYDLRINTVVIRRTALRYDVSTAAPADSGRFDPNHIALSDIRPTCGCHAYRMTNIRL